MKRISSVVLFLFFGVLSFGQNLIQPKQIKPDTLNRIIIMTDTITEDALLFREFQYYSIDSLVKDIVNDSLGIYALWSKSTDDIYNTNVDKVTVGTNEFVGVNYKFGVNGSLYTTYPENSGLFNFVIRTGNTLSSMTSGTYNFVTGASIAGSVTAPSTNLLNGQSHHTLATTINRVFNNGLENGKNGNLFRDSFFNGSYNFNSSTSYAYYSLFNGDSNMRTGNGRSNGSAFIGDRNGYAMNQAEYFHTTGLFNLYNTNRVRSSLAVGESNLYTSTGINNYNSLVGADNAYFAASLNYSTLSGYRNIYQSTSILNNIIAIGQENGYNNVSHSNSIYLGYRQGYTTGAANKLMIGMVEDDYLLGGDFAADWIRVNGYLEVRDKTGTAGNLAAWATDKLVDSGIAASSVLTSEVDGSVTNEGLLTLSDVVANESYKLTSNTAGSDELILKEGANIALTRSLDTIFIASTASGDPDQTLSYDGSLSQLTISGSGGNTIDVPEMVAYPIGSTGYGYRPEIGGVLSGGEPLLITQGSGINIIDNGVGTGFSIAATDASATNELQTISKTGGGVTLSDGGGSFETHTVAITGGVAIVDATDAITDVTTGDIDITLRGTNATTIIGTDANGWITDVPLSGLSISSGTLVAADNSATNELQTLSYTANTGVLSLTSSGTVQLPWEDIGTYVQPANTADHVRITDGLEDAGGSTGTAGQVLSSTGTQVDWIAAPAGSKWTDFGLYVGTTFGEHIYAGGGSNVGIGTTTPTYGLDVSSASTVRILGDLYDKDTSNGNAGDILTSTGTQIDWVTPSININPPLGVMLNSGTVSTSSTTYTKLAFNTSKFALGSITNSTVNDRITVPVAGYYSVTFNGFCSATATDGIEFIIYKNGSIYDFSYNDATGVSASLNNHISFSRIVQMSATDYVEIFFKSSLGTSTVSVQIPYFEVRHVRN